MKTLLWFDRYFPLDDNSTASDGNIFKLPSFEYLDFGDANQAYMTIEYWAMGAGAASTEVMLQRSAAREDNDDAFEDMMTTALALTRGHGVHSVSFGADGAAGNKYPRGIGRFVATNTSITPGEFAGVRLRISVAMVDG